MKIKAFTGYFWVTCLLGASVASCKKEDNFLNKKANNFDVVPTTLSDFQAILDDDDIVMNTGYPMIGLIGTDNVYLTSAAYGSLTAPENTAYSWTADIWEGGPSLDWNNPYKIVEYANVVLDGIRSIQADSSSAKEYNNVRGSALFFRAFAFYNIASLFCTPYAAATAGTDLGIPLRINSDVNVVAKRSTVQETYDQITNDLKTAIGLLPATGLFKSRPTSTSAKAILAKVYLCMEDYTNSFLYADQVLSVSGTIMDFNDPALVQPGNQPPFPSDPNSNPEILFYAQGVGYNSIIPGYGSGYVDKLLFDSYAQNDLRKTTFYSDEGNNDFSFVGTYDAFDGYNFAGIATNEIYLIRAECEARAGNIPSALLDLNNLLDRRFVTGTYIPITTNSTDSLLQIIFQERRKELPFTGNIRWEDLRRLNKDPKFAITLQRSINGSIYTLPPNDLRYTYPFPDNEIQLSGIQQNKR
jgi:hypothetical protein